MRDGDSIRPGSHADMDRLVEGERAREMEIPANADYAVIFGGPTKLLETAHALAIAREPPAEMLICHPYDYRASGLHRYGSETHIAILPRLLSFEFGSERPDARMTVAVLRPADACPLGHVFVVPRR